MIEPTVKIESVHFRFDISLRIIVVEPVIVRAIVKQRVPRSLCLQAYLKNVVSQCQEIVLFVKVLNHKELWSMNPREKFFLPRIDQIQKT